MNLTLTTKKSQSRIICDTIYIFLFLVCISFFYGCATPRVTANPNIAKEKFDDYEFVYINAPNTKEEDPRNILPEVVKRLENLGFKVQIINEKNPMDGGQGTGFVIDPRGYILTCAHVFEKENEASIWIQGKRYMADVVETDKENDFALLKLRHKNNLSSTPLPIADSTSYKMGEPVYTIGFPLSDILGNAPRLNKGFVSSTVGLKDNPDQIQISVEIQPGNSGSPLLDDNGMVVGIIQSTLNPINILAKTGGSLPQNVNFAMKADVIQRFLKNTGIEFKAVFDSSNKIGFDQVSKSVVQIRAGNITETFLKKPKLVCNVSYLSFWDIWYRFRVFQIEFFDIESGESILKAGQYGDNALSTETKVMDETFEQIKGYFRPQNN